MDRIYFHYNHFNSVPNVSPGRKSALGSGAPIPKNRYWGDPHLKLDEKSGKHNPAGPDRRFKISENNSPLTFRDTNIVVIWVSNTPNSREKDTCVVSSLEQLVQSMRRDNLGTSFNGTFLIKDVGHRTILPNTETMLQQMKVMMPVGGNRKRLPTSAPRRVRDIEKALLGGGYFFASYVDGTKLG